MRALRKAVYGICVMHACVYVCNCMCVYVLKKCPPHRQDILCSLSILSLEHASLLKHYWRCVTFLLLVIGLECCFFWVKNVEFIDILGILVLLDRGRRVWHLHFNGLEGCARREKVWDNFCKGLPRIEIETFLRARGFGSCPVLKSCRNGRQIAAYFRRYTIFHY